jgi:hypothetical protein
VVADHEASQYQGSVGACTIAKRQAIRPHCPTWVRPMPTSDYRPDLMGHASLEPSGCFEAGSWQSFALTYTAGRFGVDDTGSIKIGFRFATDFGPVQFSDPAGPGFTTVEASNGATLETKWEFKRNIRPWSRSLYVGVAKDFLAPGDTITIRFGDRRFGSPGIRVQTYCETAFEFHVLADPIATYDYIAVPKSPTISIVPGPGTKWFAILRQARDFDWRLRSMTSGATRLTVWSRPCGSAATACCRGFPRLCG